MEGESETNVNEEEEEDEDEEEEEEELELDDELLNELPPVDLEAIEAVVKKLIDAESFSRS